jgi:hypothetical protein
MELQGELLYALTEQLKKAGPSSLLTRRNWKIQELMNNFFRKSIFCEA